MSALERVVARHTHTRWRCIYGPLSVRMVVNLPCIPVRKLSSHPLFEGIRHLWSMLLSMDIAEAV